MFFKFILNNLIHIIPPLVLSLDGCYFESITHPRTVIATTVFGCGCLMFIVFSSLVNWLALASSQTSLRLFPSWDGNNWLSVIDERSLCVLKCLSCMAAHQESQARKQVVKHLNNKLSYAFARANSTNYYNELWQYNNVQRTNLSARRL